MQQVKIYIETDSSSPKATEKHYGYVLEVMVSGQAVTREGFGKITGTYHQTVLTALAERYPEIRHVYRGLRNKYLYEDDKYIIRPARSAEEIVMEGRLLHHCVGGNMYLGRHNKGETYILMLRFKAEPDIPYITVEIDAKNPRILQWYGDKDKKPDEKNMQSWLNNWLMKLKTGTLTETIQTAAIA